MSEIDETNCIYYQECIQFADGEEIYHICNDDKNLTTYCQDSYNCYYKQLQQLRADNNELKDKLKIAMTAEAFVKTQKEYTNLDKYKATLDEIEGIAQNCLHELCMNCKYHNNCNDVLEIILNIIKQAKEGGE